MSNCFPITKKLFHYPYQNYVSNYIDYPLFESWSIIKSISISIAGFHIGFYECLDTN